MAESEGRKVGNASWGRGMRHAVGGWFVTKPPMQLAYQVPAAFPTGETILLDVG